LKTFLTVIFLVILFESTYSIQPRFFKLKQVAVSSLPKDLIAPDLKSVTIDPEGNVFAFAGKPHGKNCFIVKFDKNLKYLKKFGRDGRGPQEFTTQNTIPDNRLSVDSLGNLCVVDYNPCKLVIFDNDGNFKNEILVSKNYSDVLKSVYHIKMVGENSFAAFQYRRNQPPMGIVFSLKPARVISRYSFTGKDIRYKFGTIGRVDFGNNSFIDTDSGHIVFGDCQGYRFQVFGKTGIMKCEVMDKNRVLTSFSKRELKEIKSGYLDPANAPTSYFKEFLLELNANKSEFNRVLNEISESKNVIADIKLSGEKIYVFPVRKDITIEEKYPVEIYNLSGKLIEKGYFPKRPARIWKGYAFFYDRDEEDDPLILKYKIGEVDSN